ncbi:NUT family member 1 [Pelodiscus sinensis]|uniref:NUT family member 1 n=1 Tax=Pelodiscus sinensis TaxID=13735 RepID=UPI003F6D35C6
MSAPPPPLLLPTFPGAALLLTSPDAPGGKLIVKLKPEGGPESARAQTIILTGAPAGWGPPRRDGAPLRLQLAAGIRTVLLSKAGEELGPREAPPAAPARAPPASDPSASCTSKGVYENYRRWQRYKALARRHHPGTPDAEALACFFIPVLRSLGRLRPELAPEEGVPRAVQEWERSSNFERMIFYEMAEKFMEFEAEEELQIQKMKLLSSSQFQPLPAEPPNLPGPAGPDAGQQQVYIPKKAASKGRQPRRRQRRPPGPPAAGEPREIPPEAVRQYAEIMEGLRPGWEEEAGGHGEPQSPAPGALPDPALLPYVEQLCADESFVCKVEAVIHPQFLAQLLSPEKRRDPLDLTEELEQELGLTPSQLVEKRLLALSEDELSPPACPASQSDSTPSQSEEEDEGHSHKGPTSRRPSSCRGGGAKSETLGAEPQEVPAPTPTWTSPRRQPQPGNNTRPEDMTTARGPSPLQRGDQGRLVSSPRSLAETASQKAQGYGQDGGRRQGAVVTTQSGSQAWGLRSQGDNLGGPANLKSTNRKQDGGQEGKANGQSEPSAGGEGLGDAPTRTECHYRQDNLMDPGALASNLSGHGKQDGCPEDMVKTQGQAGGEALGDAPGMTSQAEIVRSYGATMMKQRAVGSTLSGRGKQGCGQGEKVRDQNQEEADWSEATSTEHDLQRGSMKLSGNHLQREGSPASAPTTPREHNVNHAGQPTILESRVHDAHPTALLLSRANGQPFSLSARLLGADGQGEHELSPRSNSHGQHPPDPSPLGLRGPKRPIESQGSSEAGASHRAEPERRFMGESGSRQLPLQDGGPHEGKGISTAAGPKDAGQREARATRGGGHGTRPRDDGKERRETNSAMGDGPSKMAAANGSAHPPADMEDAGKHGDNEEDDEELSVFSSLLASKLRLSSPEVSAVSAPRDRVTPLGRALSPTWQPGRWDPARRRSTRLCPSGVLKEPLATDPGIRHSHKRKGDNMAARRSKRLRSQ